MSHWPPDYCFEQLKKHREIVAAAAGTNEADTRLRAVNTLLFQVLGWDVLDVNAEKYVRAVGYADYAIHVDGSLAMIIEAKKADESFVIPNVTFPAGASGFGLLAKECPEADKALRQAIGYAASLGVRYVGITNGHQWLIALTYVPSQTVDERQVIVFESLDALERKFRLFW
jgi:predicted type IV restriction endonuclease